MTKNYYTAIDEDTALDETLPDEERSVLKYLATKQGQWTCLWNGYFKDSDPNTDDVFYAMPSGTTDDQALRIMRALYGLQYVGGCCCGCRGDFEITDSGLASVGLKRERSYTGY